MRRSGSYRNAVSKVVELLATHDPLGVGEPSGDVPANEYEPEAAEIVRILSRRESSTVEAAAEVIHGVFVSAFGPDDADSVTTYDRLAAAVLDTIAVTREK